MDAPATASLADDRQVRLAFTNQAVGNVSLVVGAGRPHEARARALGLVGLPADCGVFMEQVHGAAVAEVDAADRGRGLTDHEEALPGVDALVTTAADVGLVVMVADCVPVLLAAPGRGVAAAHAGRDGIAAGVVPAAVEALAHTAEVGADALVAFIGPAIGGCCYEVPESLAAQFAAAVPEAEARTTWGTASLDLPAAAVAQLHRLGVQRVERLGACTRCHGERWFSHRATAEGAAPGRQAGVIARVTASGGHPSLHSR